MTSIRNLLSDRNDQGVTARIRYAALPWRISNDGRLEIMLVGSRCGSSWTVPADAMPHASSPSRSAERAAFQEAGVIGRIGAEPIGSYRIPPPAETSGDPSQITVFGVYVLGTLANWKEERRRRRRWWRLEEAHGAVEEPALAALLRSLIAHSSKTRCGVEPDTTYSLASDRIRASASLQLSSSFDDDSRR